MSAVQTGKFVHVVASVDLAGGAGKLLYVNPSTVSAKPEAEPSGAPGPESQPAGDFELLIEDAEGRALKSIRPTILLPSDTEGAPTTGLIDEDIPYIEGMKRLVLLHGGSRVSVHEAGAPAPLAAAGSALDMGVAPPGQSEKRMMTLENARPEQGISYTVQVRPEGTASWQTIAVGRNTPDFRIDRNQFAGADRASVRVLRTTGFEDQIVAEQEIDLSFDEKGSSAERS
jgi:hypothetical protein